MAGQMPMQSMQMPTQTIQGSASAPNRAAQQNQQIAKQVSSQGVLGEVQRALDNPEKRAALERFMKTLEQAEQAQ